MAPPVKPAAPAITARTADSLTADWPAVAAASYVLRARDAAGLVREITTAVAPARIDGLAANEQYSVTLEAKNPDGGSGESAATLDWTMPPEPRTAPVVYVSLRDGVVSIGWDLTAELATLHHPDMIAVEVGRSDSANPLGQPVGRGKIRDLVLDWRAPVGPLQYRLRLRAERPPPDAPAVSDWGPAVAIVKPMPAGSSQHAPLQLDGKNRPALGGLSPRALLLAADEEGDYEDDNEGNSNDNSGDNSNADDNNSDGSDQGDDQGGSSSDDNEDGDDSDESSGRPDDSDAVDAEAVRPAIEINTTGDGPFVSMELMGGYEVRETDGGTWERHVEMDGQGEYHPIGEWEFRGSETSDSGSSGGGSERDEMLSEPGAGDQAPDAGTAASPGEATAHDSGGGDTGGARIESWENDDRLSRSGGQTRTNAGMTLRSDRGDARRAGPDNYPERPKASAKPGSAGSKSSRAGSAAPGLADRFRNFLSSFRGTHSSVRGRAAGSSRGGHGGRLATGTPETNAAIREAANRFGLDVSFMQAVASIESGMNPTIVNRLGYSGLYQFGEAAWTDYGRGGDRLDVRANAMAAARMFAANRQRLERKFGREPTPTELYIAHQQGLGFYLNGANSTNMQANHYPGISGAQTAQSFEASWGAEIERRMRYFESISRGAPDPSVAPSSQGASQQTTPTLRPGRSGQPVRLP